MSQPPPRSPLEAAVFAAQEDMEQRVLGRLEASLAPLVQERERALGELAGLRGRIRELREGLDRAERVLLAKEEEIAHVFVLRVQEERAACLRHIRSERARLTFELSSLLDGEPAPWTGRGAGAGGESQ